MLIQAQSQQERKKSCKITADDTEIKNADESESQTSGNDGENDVEMTEINAVKEENERKATELASERMDLESSQSSEKPNDNKDESSTDDQVDKEAIKIEDNEEEDLYSKDISIDPRTYCKLGHFHLLMEDYPKGVNQSIIIFICQKPHFGSCFDSHVGVPEILQFGKGKLEGHAIPVRTRTRLLPLQRLQMVSLKTIFLRIQFQPREINCESGILELIAFDFASYKKSSLFRLALPLHFLRRCAMYLNLCKQSSWNWPKKSVPNKTFRSEDGFLKIHKRWFHSQVKGAAEKSNKPRLCIQNKQTNKISEKWPGICMSDRKPYLCFTDAMLN